MELHIENVHDSNISIQVITTDAATYGLAYNPRIRQSVNKLTKPLDRQGIDRVEISDGSTLVESISKEQRAYYYPMEAIAEVAAQTVSESGTRIVELEIVSPVFKPNNKWRLTDGNAVYNVKIADEDFLQKVERHEITFGRGDILKVLLQHTTVKTSDGLKTAYTVLEVIENVTPPKLPY